MKLANPVDRHYMCRDFQIVPDWVVDLSIKNIVWNDHTSIDTTALEVATYFGLRQ